MANLATPNTQSEGKGKSGRKSVGEKLKAAEARIAELEAKLAQPQRRRGRKNPLDDQPFDEHGFADTFFPD